MTIEEFEKEWERYGPGEVIGEVETKQEMEKHLEEIELSDSENEI